MWVVSTLGAFSIVVDRNRSGGYLVRARAREDLVRLLEQTRIEQSILTTTDSDYPHRIFIDSSEFAAVMSALGSSVDYPNFKDAVATEGQFVRLPIYTRVWQQLAHLTRLLDHGLPQPWTCPRCGAVVDSPHCPCEFPDL